MGFTGKNRIRRTLHGNWVELESANGSVYYADLISKETSWDPPPGGDDDPHAKPRFPEQLPEHASGWVSSWNLPSLETSRVDVNVLRRSVSADNRSSLDSSRVEHGISRRSSLQEHPSRANYSSSLSSLSSLSSRDNDDWLWLDQQSREESGNDEDIKTSSESHPAKTGGANTKPAHTNPEGPRRADNNKSGFGGDFVEQKILARIGDWVKTTDPVTGREYWANPRTCQVGLSMFQEHESVLYFWFLSM
jgi:hypothetical protein